eukprot:6213496-Pleurochrysis_carterae.AAC.2
MFRCRVSTSSRFKVLLALSPWRSVPLRSNPIVLMQATPWSRPDPDVPRRDVTTREPFVNPAERVIRYKSSTEVDNACLPRRAQAGKQN